jgi:hypothetical protein
MAIERLETGLDMVRRHKLSDLAYREDVSDAEMLRRLVDRAYEADLESNVEAMKPNSAPPPPVFG